MALAFEPSAQPYATYENPSWPSEYKPAFAEREAKSHHEGESSSCATPAGFHAPPSRRSSTMKVEDDFNTHEVIWNQRHHPIPVPGPSRHYSYPAFPPPGYHQPPVKVDPVFAASYHAQSQWPSQSGTSTPTATYHGPVGPYSQPVQPSAPHGFNFNQDPMSAVSMSPQSSQGGWASASSDGQDQPTAVNSPIFRPESPHLVQRSDGIRKRNARFDIPANRKLENIDALIAGAKDDTMKKELKQQKRLLRNRQAALDSRQRKKTHTERLENEKKDYEKRLRDLEIENEQLSMQLMQQDEMFARQRQQYDYQIQQLVHDRDEAIKAKTLEAAECRRQMNMMRDFIRDHHMERSGYEPAAEMHTFTADFGEFTMQDEWETEINMFPHPELDAEDEQAQRQATPKPAPSTAITKKADTDFSWNTFYMCLLFGAVVISAGNSLSKVTTSRTDISLPSISDESRVDAENVLKAVMSSRPQEAQDMTPARSSAAPLGTAASSHHSVMTHCTHPEQSSLESLSASLTAPTKEQEIRQAFAMSAQTYNHLVNPLGDLTDDDADADFTESPKPTRLEQYMANFNAQRSELPAHEDKYARQSVLADLIPDNVMEEFRAFVHEHHIKSDD